MNFFKLMIIVGALSLAPTELWAAGPKSKSRSALTVSAKKKENLKERRAKQRRSQEGFKVAKKERNLDRRLMRRGLRANLGRSFD